MHKTNLPQELIQTKINSAQGLAVLIQDFMVFLSPFRQLPGTYLKLGQNHFFAHILHLIVNPAM